MRITDPGGRDMTWRMLRTWYPLAVACDGAGTELDLEEAG